ncbi:lipopolysaccharide biosynthesis protein [Arcobacter defluvii]|uniref:Polysaccharide biosynthesis protein n=1 Tax=Arcobacter defluvii TaxID=873191 RepID=A0AAE7BF28_9BACT|nr:oligosaccharide flippase family protein [Arcobacter defluvii]QKF76872.1 polysaccharide biosynthesis protein [Arcobacter defluvii]RXI33790.1 polysaccharide biosynthesis family protein [Arcobacter defluvii]
MTIKKFLVLALGPIGAAFFSLITLPFIAWFFNAEDVGRFNMLQVFLGLTVTIFSLQMHQSYVREYYEEEDKEMLLKMTILPGFFLLIIAIILLFIFSFSISKILFDVESFEIDILVLLTVISSFFINSFSHVIRMMGKEWFFAISQIFPKIILFILLGVILLFNFEYSFLILMNINTITLVLSTILFIYLSNTSWKIFKLNKINLLLLNKIVKFSLPLVLGGLAYWGLSYIDRFFLKNYSGLEEVGIYSIASTLAGVISIFTTVFATIWHPLIFKWIKEGIDPKRVQNVINILFVFITFIWSIFGLFSWIIPIFLPENYELVQYIIVGCTAGSLLYLLSEATTVGIGISRRSIFSLLSSFLAFVVSVILNYLLVPCFGGIGASISIMISFYIFFIIRTEATIYLWHFLDRKLIYAMLFLYILNTIFMLIIKPNSMMYSITWIFLFIFSLIPFYKTIYKIIKNRGV